jgi:hypothetical protein
MDATPVYFGRCLSRVPAGSLTLFPLDHTLLSCGIAGIVAFKRPPASRPGPSVSEVAALADRVGTRGFEACIGADGRLSGETVHRGER